jgi:hypothetical protein
LSNAARWAKPGALILQRYGREEPSETKYTPNSPKIIYKPIISQKWMTCGTKKETNCCAKDSI